MECLWQIFHELNELGDDCEGIEWRQANEGAQE